MLLYFKKTSKEARKAMCDAATNISYLSRNVPIQTAEEGITNITGHKYAKIVNSGNSAILAVMSVLKGKILIPDQGGWIGFKKIAEFLGIEIIEIPTNLGIIDPEILNEFIDNHNPQALFLTSLAGYIAEQPVKELFEVCDDRGVVLVEDASGGIGDTEKRMGNGDQAHIIIASTGSPKIINVGNGGFISTNDNELFKNNKYILKTLKADPVTCAGIAEEIKNASLILSETIKACDIIKKEFDNVIHPGKRGITIALRTDDPKKTGYKLRNRLKVVGGNIVSVCPRYERVMTDAVCLEIKNLDWRCLTNDVTEKIIQIVKEE